MSKVLVTGCVEVEHNFDTYEVEYTIDDNYTIIVKNVYPAPHKTMDVEKLLKQKLTPNTSNVNSFTYR